MSVEKKANNEQIDIVSSIRQIANMIEAGKFSASYTINTFTGFDVPTGMHEIVIRYWDMKELLVYAKKTVEILEAQNAESEVDLQKLPA